ncbi:MarR family winged helix-turn-helix transcriptional regulator [Pseudonocardia sp. DR1-2]|uniref:MarR family transcriptional regulator n=1 Tax=Pseudonocardia sp. DR1-2 TaxID=2951168 RepID=UPI002043F6A9|nr:MarR family transcriptional regulator [Pseudonocardia sp. DR1-2]MCM3849751.1 MarR family winged helix-turn-helix transcriptional regulator [Pseudonocardia sp. DR1-2]
MSEPAEHVRPSGDESLRLLCAVGRTLDQELDDALRGCGSDVDQWRVLGLLASRGGCTMSVVAEHALLLAPRATKLVDRMTAANLVHRRPDVVDRRRVLVVATGRGRAALADWDAAAAGVLDRYRDLLGSDAALFDDVLRRLQDATGRAGAPGLARLATTEG